MLGDQLEVGGSVYENHEEQDYNQLSVPDDTNMCKYLDFIKDELNSNLINVTNNLINRNIATQTDVNWPLSENHEKLDNGFSVTYHSDDNHYRIRVTPIYKTLLKQIHVLTRGIMKLNL